MGQGSGRIVAGLDVHKRSTRIAAVQGDRLVREVTVASDAEIVQAALLRLGVAACCYEAGPTGYGLARALHAAGIGCIVAAPGKIERPAQDRVKTDRRDAERLVRLLMVDGLHAVRVPSGEEEALRDLVRARARTSAVT